jgi:hypothetical protein
LPERSWGRTGFYVDHTARLVSTARDERLLDRQASLVPML